MILQSMLGLFQLVLKACLTMAGLKDPAFKKRLKEKDFVMLIRTRDRKTAGYFSLKGGKLSSKAPRSATPDILIEWTDALTAVRVLSKTSLTAMVDSFSQAILNGDLVLEIQAEPAVWFAGIMKDLAAVFASLGPKRFKR